jgi:hypothetical protein
MYIFVNLLFKGSEVKTEVKGRVRHSNDRYKDGIERLISEPATKIGGQARHTT